MEEEKDLNLYPLSTEDQKIKRDKRSDELKYVMERGTLEIELKKQKKVVFITPTQNLVEQQATTIDVYTDLCVGRYQGG